MSLTPLLTRCQRIADGVYPLVLQPSARWGAAMVNGWFSAQQVGTAKVPNALFHAGSNALVGASGRSAHLHAYLLFLSNELAVHAIDLT